MAVQRTINNEWRAQNDATRYPFSNGASLTSRDDRMLLEGTFLDAALFPIGGKPGLYLSAVELTHQQATIYIGDSGDSRRCSGTFDILQPSANVSLYDTVGRPAGVIISESSRLGILQSWGIGVHEFDQSASEFCASVCMPTPEVGLQGVRLPDGSVLTGEVWFVGEDGVVLRTTEETRNGETVTVIRVDVVGDPLFRRRLCSPQDLFATPKFIKQIRVLHSGGEFLCSPDEDGNIRLAEDNALNENTVMRVRNTADGIIISMAGKRD